MEVGMMDRTNEELTRLSNLIGLIYEGATDPGRWTEDIMPAMAQYIQVPDCILFTPLHTPKDGGYAFMYGRSPEQHDRYTRTHQHEDPYIKVALERNLLVEGNVILGDEVVPRQQWLESAIYKECYSSHPNLGQMMTSIVFGLDSTTVMPVACTFFRGLHHSNFNGQDRARLQLLLPHISRSLGVMQRLRSAELAVATTLTALNRLPSGVLLLDDAGRVSFANHTAQRMLEKADGLHLRKSAHAAGLGELDADDVSVSRAISTVIKATLKRDPYDTPHFSKSVVVPHRSGLGNYTLQFSALGQHNEFGGEHSGHAAIVFIADSAQKSVIDPAVLQGAYGLTAAEARVAITMLEHVSAKDVASVLDVSPNTVRTQIKTIYVKLGVDTRTRFVKAILGLASHCS
jgi:DNA-binding CsgD family transcriptional regulator